jgi:indolepyruvate ferredoxin oxidoreductase
MVGYAAQKGLLPVSTASLEEAIRLNGTFVEGNLRTFALGRLAAHAPEAFADLASEHKNLPRLETAEAVVASRKRLLTDYQDAAYAQRYEDFVRDVERRVGDRKVAGSGAFVREVALTLARLMAYKDEYEVARLHSDPKFLERLNAQFAGDFKVTFHLAPPILPGRDPATGLARKREFGAWMLPVFRVLKSFKGLRGTPFDVFGHTRERRMERRLIEEFRTTIDAMVPRLTEHNVATATELARAAADVRGYGHVKDESVEAFHARKDKLLATFDGAPPVQQRKTIFLASEKA